MGDHRVTAGRAGGREGGRLGDSAMPESQLVELKDGRRLEYEVHGVQDGPALVFHHGTPGSCLPFATLAAAAASRGLRLVTTSRAGYGESSRQAGRRVVAAAADTGELLDALGIEDCLVAGWSGGGPHALACGARLAGRARAVLVIAGVAPADADGLDFLTGMGEANLDEFGLAERGEAALRPFLETQREALRTAAPEDLAAALTSLLPPVDVRALEDGVAVDLEAQIQHGVASGVEGWLDDDLAFVAPWGFSLDEIAVPTSLWQGDQDLMVPPAHGRWLAAQVPGVVAHLEAGEGHISIGARLMDRMLDELLALSG
ncbi:MAG TPA: alpha/beta hydrolase [Acidimicrobiales bacterium]|nr:alpha/beta hydrolase [Acidimicrobiales bacterium]